MLQVYRVKLKFNFFQVCRVMTQLKLRRMSSKPTKVLLRAFSLIKESSPHSVCLIHSICRYSIVTYHIDQTELNTIWSGPDVCIA